MSPEKLGQHFLADESWLDRIEDEVRIDGGTWVEIGAGHGEMTTRLARRASKVLAIELDPSVARRLRNVTALCKNVEVVETDVLAADFEKLTGGAFFRLWKFAVLHYFAHPAPPVRARRTDRGNSHCDSV
jgi:16S rRNA (adenine1518-N6/adenine1519-N6)-dimethyltransferase